MGLMACNSAQKKNEGGATAYQHSLIKDNEAATEETVLHPKFDENKICGLGVFKIGVSIDSSIGWLIKEKKFQLDSIRTSAQYRERENDYNHVYRIQTPLSIDERGVEEGHVPIYNWCSDVAVFAIKKYMIDSLVIEHMILSYYNNKLVKLQCLWHYDLHNALEYKYGNEQNDTISNANGHEFIRRYDNMDIEVVNYQPNNDDSWYLIDVKGGRYFLQNKSVKSWSVLDSLRTANKNKGFKNL